MPPDCSGPSPCRDGPPGAAREGRAPLPPTAEPRDTARVLSAVAIPIPLAALCSQLAPVVGTHRLEQIDGAAPPFGLAGPPMSGPECRREDLDAAAGTPPWPFPIPRCSIDEPQLLMLPREPFGCLLGLVGGRSKQVWSSSRTRWPSRMASAVFPAEANSCADFQSLSRSASFAARAGSTSPLDPLA